MRGVFAGIVWRLSSYDAPGSRPTEAAWLWDIRVGNRLRGEGVKRSTDFAPNSQVQVHPLKIA